MKPLMPTFNQAVLTVQGILIPDGFDTTQDETLVDSLEKITRHYEDEGRILVWSNRERSNRPAYREVVHVQTNAVAFAKSSDPEDLALAKAKPHSNATWLYFDQKGDNTL